MIKSIDICVLTAGRFDLLKTCLDGIDRDVQFTQGNVSIDIKTYVFDNGSKSEDAIMFKSLFSHPVITRSRRSGHNLGFPGGANSAIRMGQSPLVLFISDDIVLEQGCILQLLDTMERDPQIGLCGLKLTFPKNSNDPGRPAGKVQHVGHSINLQGEIIHPFLGWSPENPRTCISGERFSVTGAVFMVRRDLFNRAGKFNESYGSGYYEDVELCLHIRGLGYKIWIDTNAKAEHFVGATFGTKQPANTIEMNKAKFIQNNRQYMTWTDWMVR